MAAPWKVHAARTLLVVFLLGHSIASGSTVGDASTFDQLLVLDCQARLHLFPSHHFATSSVVALSPSLQTFVKQGLFDTVNAMVKRRAQCHCPALSDAQFQASFKLDPSSIISAVSDGSLAGNLGTVCNTADTTFVRSWSALWTELGSLGQWPKSTCSAATWQQGNGCKVELPLDPQATLQVGINSCPGQALPFVSISCRGARCRNLARPCATSADCQRLSQAPGTPANAAYAGLNQLDASTGLQCAILNPARDDSFWAQRGIPPTNATYVSGILVGLLESVGLYTQTDLDNGRCGASGPEVAGKMWARALQYLQSLYRTDTAATPDGLCVPSALVTDIADRVKLPAPAQTCKNVTAMCEYPQYPLVTSAISCDACYANPYVSTSLTTYKTALPSNYWASNSAPGEVVWWKNRTVCVAADGLGGFTDGTAAPPGGFNSKDTGNTRKCNMTAYDLQPCGADECAGQSDCLDSAQFCGDSPDDIQAPPPASPTASTSYEFGLDQIPGYPIAWGGKLEDGTPVFDPPRKDGTAFRLPQETCASPAGALPVLRLSCGRPSLQLTPMSPIAVRIALPDLQGLLTTVHQQLLTWLVGCRLGGPAVPAGQVRAWFDAWQPDFWSTLLFSGGHQYAVQHFLSLASPWSVMRTAITAATPGTWPSLLAMPAGCTLADWMTSGTCRLQFSGLRAMLDRDVTLRAVITRCPAFPEGLPDVYLDCVGADCTTVFQPYSLTACDSDSACGANTRCVQLFNSTDPLANLLWLPDGVNASALNSDTCASPSAFITDVQNLVRTAAGLPVAPTGQPQGSGVCMPDLLKLVNGANLTWFDAQLNTSGLTGQTSVNGLAEYAKLAGEQGHPCGDDVMSQLSATSFSLVVTLTVGGPSAAGFGATQKGQLANAVAKMAGVPSEQVGILSASDVVLSASDARRRALLTSAPTGTFLQADVGVQAGSYVAALALADAVRASEASGGAAASVAASGLTGYDVISVALSVQTNVALEPLKAAGMAGRAAWGTVAVGIILSLLHALI